jgi:hypothetical protein
MHVVRCFVGLQAARKQFARNPKWRIRTNPFGNVPRKGNAKGFPITGYCTGMLIGVGLVLQVLTLFSIKPLSFMAFLMIACPLVAVGILLYLYTLVSHGTPPGAKEGE